MADTTPVNRTYSVTVGHMQKIALLAIKLSKNQSEVVREAVNEYFEKHLGNPKMQAATATDTSAQAD